MVDFYCLSVFSHLHFYWTVYFMNKSPLSCPIKIPLNPLCMAQISIYLAWNLYLGAIHLSFQLFILKFWPLPPHFEYIECQQITKKSRTLRLGNFPRLKWMALYELLYRKQINCHTYDLFCFFNHLYNHYNNSYWN